MNWPYRLMNWLACSPPERPSRYQVIVPERQREMARRLGIDEAIFYVGRTQTDPQARSAPNPEAGSDA